MMGAQIDMSRSFYLAGSWHWREQCAGVARGIEQRTEARCTSRWLHSTLCDDDPADRRLGADQCINDIARADCVLVLVGDRPSLGKHVEIGVGLAVGKPVILLVPPWTEDPIERIRERCAFYELCHGPYTANAPLPWLGEALLGE